MTGPGAVPSRIAVLPLRTPTIPPATTTNCYRLGDSVIDPGSPWPDEQARLLAWLGASGAATTRVLLTHHHHDHVGGVEALVRATGAEVWAHHDARVHFRVDRRLGDGDRVDTGAGVLRCLHTPGHADGHLAFTLEGAAETVVGDLLAGEGTIVVAPPEGHLATYLASLGRLLEVGGALLPAHGPALIDGPAAVQRYIAHRHARTAQIEAAVRAGGDTAARIADAVYAGIPGVDMGLAAAQVRAHLRWLAEHARARSTDGTHWEAT
jgi:ribonuclease/clavin/mitogillin